MPLSDKFTNGLPLKWDMRELNKWYLDNSPTYQPAHDQLADTSIRRQAKSPKAKSQTHHIIN